MPENITPKMLAALRSTNKLDGKNFIARVVQCGTKECGQSKALSFSASIPKCPRHGTFMEWIGSVYENPQTGKRFRYRR